MGFYLIAAILAAGACGLIVLPLLRKGASGKRTALIVAGVIVIGAAVLYAQLGNPDLPDKPLASRSGADQQAQAFDDSRHPDMNRLVAQLQERLQERPDDLTGWGLLARSLMSLGRADEAVAAYQRTIELGGGEDPRLMGDYAEARIMAAQGVIDAETAGIFRKILADIPQNVRARYYLAQAKLQSGDEAGALAAFQALYADGSADAAWRPAVAQQIAALGGSVDAGPLAQPVPAPGPGPTADQVAAASQMTADDRAQMIEGMVAGLAERLEQNPDDLEGWLRLARSYTVLGRQGDAVNAYEKALGLDPDQPDALWALGGFAAQSGDVSQARAYLKRLLRVVPPDTELHTRAQAALETL